VLELEQEGKEQGDWGFKALKQMIKISFRLVSMQLYIKQDHTTVLTAIFTFLLSS